MAVQGDPRAPLNAVFKRGSGRRVLLRPVRFRTHVVTAARRQCRQVLAPTIRPDLPRLPRRVACDVPRHRLRDQCAYRPAPATVAHKPHAGAGMGTRQGHRLGVELCCLDPVDRGVLLGAFTGPHRASCSNAAARPSAAAPDAARHRRRTIRPRQRPWGRPDALDDRRLAAYLLPAKSAVRVHDRDHPRPAGAAWVTATGPHSRGRGGGRRCSRPVVPRGVGRDGPVPTARSDHPLIVAAAQRDLSTRGSVWSSWPLVLLGAWSYAFYLSHQLILRAWFHHIGDAPRTAWLPTVSWFVILLAVAICVAGLMFRLVKRPAERRLRGTSGPRVEVLAAADT